jgi:hypothetical protein
VVVLTLVAAAVPFLASLSSGRFDLPTTSVAESLSTLAPSPVGGYRVLWLADASVIPLAGWTVVPGLTAGTSSDGLPGGGDLFAPPGAGAAVALLRDVRRALEGGTVRLGQLLAPAGISAIVVMNTASPQVAGFQSSPTRAVPSTLEVALGRQVDLSLELQTRSVEVYANSLFHGVVAQSTAKGGLTPALGEPGVSASLAPGEDVVAGLAPASAFSLEVDGVAAPRVATPRTWTGRYQVAATGASPTGRIVVRRFPWNGLLAALTLLAWLYAATGFGGRRLGADVSLRSAVSGRHVRRDDA